jgi:hypothetical protein
VRGGVGGGSREQGAGSREQGAGSREQGAGSREQGAGSSRERGRREGRRREEGGGRRVEGGGRREEGGGEGTFQNLSNLSTIARLQNATTAINPWKFPKKYNSRAKFTENDITCDFSAGEGAKTISVTSH